MGFRGHRLDPQRAHSRESGQLPFVIAEVSGRKNFLADWFVSGLFDNQTTRQPDSQTANWAVFNASSPKLVAPSLGPQRPR